LEYQYADRRNRFIQSWRLRHQAAAHLQCLIINNNSDNAQFVTQHMWMHEDVLSNTRWHLNQAVDTVYTSWHWHSWALMCRIGKGTSSLIPRPHIAEWRVVICCFQWNFRNQHKQVTASTTSLNGSHCRNSRSTGLLISIKAGRLSVLVERKKHIQNSRCSNKLTVPAPCSDGCVVIVFVTLHCQLYTMTVVSPLPAPCWMWWLCYDRLCYDLSVWHAHL